MQLQHADKLKYIKIAMIFINLIAVLFVPVFLYVTTRKIYDHFIAREFLENVDAIPDSPLQLCLITAGLFLVLMISFFIREGDGNGSIKVIYSTIIVDFIISITIIWILNFNYNGVLFLVFANLITYAKGKKGKYLLMFFAIASFLIADYDLVGINYRLYSIHDYIAYYDANTQKYILAFYNIIISLNMVTFIIYCIYVIQEQRGTIDEVNLLYDKLSKANDELQDANVQLKEYAVITEKIGETRERNRLAREIHDTLGHTLTGISAGVDACLATVDASPKQTKKQLELIADVTRSGILDVRRSVNKLRPDALARLSLESAILELVKETKNISGTKIHFKNQVEKLKFDEDEENAIYRVTQESLTNAIRHGKAENVWISIEKEDSKLLLTIRDDGVGCKEIVNGFGTRHITERIEMLNGTVQFDGRKGFTVYARIPIRWGEEYD